MSGDSRKGKERGNGSRTEQALHDSELSYRREDNRSRPADDLRARAENSMGKTRRKISATAIKNLPKMVHELQVHEIELRMQNEELHHTQQELEEACKRYANLYDFAPSPLLTLSANGKILEANLAAASLLGVERKSLIRQNFTRFIRPEARDDFHLKQHHVLEAGTKQVSELEMNSVGGDRLTVRLEGVAEEDPSGHRTRYRISLADITERKEIEKELLWKTAFLEAQANSSLDGILVVDSQRRQILQNQKMIDLWKFPVEFAHETKDALRVKWAASQVKNPQAFAERIVHLYAHPAEVSRDEFELIDGRIFDRYSAPVHGKDEKYYGRIWAFRDITERKQFEQKVLEIREVEQRRIGQDLHDDLCQLLAGLQLFSGLLVRDLTVKSLPEAAAAARLSAGISKSIDHARLLARGLSPVIPTFGGLSAALKGLSENVGVLFQVRCKCLCDPAFVLKDSTTATHLYRIAQESITNAVKHGHAKKIVVKVTSRKNDCQLVITSDGSGFSAKNEEHEGMGLRTMRSRATLIGGSLDVHSVAGKGTSVTCTFPKHIV